MCVYCGSRLGRGSDYEILASAIGTGLAERGMTMVYGAGSIGLMGVAARAALDGGGDVIGVIPQHLDKIEITERNLTELHVTKNMHDRKRLMFDRSDAFFILPGGLGTLDEMMEILTWAQLSLHKRPIVLINHHGYWDQVLSLFSHIITEGFASDTANDLFSVVNDEKAAFAIIDDHDCHNDKARTDLF